MDTRETRHPSNPAQPAVRPLLRAVLICDIVESTALVERLGDVRAAGFLQRHDQLMRQAMRLCEGQIVDKADGVLALFERPIQALDFALRYQRGLSELGKAEGLELKARTGIHVGDVMTWANDPRDVQAGAKPFEVEGLAKPVAARLMNLALPGQILMSGMAQTLAQRAAGELGERAGRLRWLMHGRYRFKGVPAPMLVHEVGEPGIAPLRPPESTAKAWRELPLWRRPPMLAAEAMLLLALAGSVLWSTFRSEPAIAFAERDWVVVADVQNRTTETLLDDSLDAALRVGLEQSRHVNLISELQLRRGLQRMLREGQPVDRQVAVELALREGARAVIVPTVAEVGKVVRVSLEVVDPTSGDTVYSESADAAGPDGVLAALDTTLDRVRGRLGERVGDVQDASEPLAKVTTDDLEALRAFSLGLKARLERRDADALALYSRAIERDPEFSMAYLRRGAALLASDPDRAWQDWQQADRHRERLTERESLLLDASLAIRESPQAMLERWKVFAALYPDEYRAHYNHAYFAHFLRQDYATALAAIEPALAAFNPLRPHSLYMKGSTLLASNRVDEAIATFEQAETSGVGGFMREYADALAARREYPRATHLLERHEGSGLAHEQFNDLLPSISHALDRGDWPAAQAATRDLETRLAEADPIGAQSVRLVSLMLAVESGDASPDKPMEAFLAFERGRTEAENPLSAPRRQARLLAAAWLATRAKLDAQAKEALALAGPADANYPMLADLARLVDAERAMRDGKAEAAVELLAPRAGAGDELYLLHAVLMRALVQAGRLEPAYEQAGWLAGQRGRAYGEPNSQYLLQPINVVEANLALLAQARLAKKLGRTEAAQRHQQSFEEAWPDGDGLPATQRRAALFD